MSEVKSNIQEVFGKFAVELEAGPKMFDTHAEALAAETEYQKGSEFRDAAAGFNAYAGNEGRPAAGKANVIIAFLNWDAAGRPEAKPVEEVEAEVEAETAEVVEAVESDEDETKTEF